MRVKSFLRKMFLGKLFAGLDKPVDFEELGYQTTLQCRGDEERARNICGLRIYDYADQLQPEFGRLQSEIEQNKKHGDSLHSHLYDRYEPVNDAAMLALSQKLRNLVVLAALATVTCFVAAAATISLLGHGLLVTFLGAIGATVIPLGVGHLGYEHIVAKHRKLQIGVIAVLTILICVAVVRFAQVRGTVMDQATASPEPVPPYVNGATVQRAAEQEPNPSEHTEAKIRNSFGGSVVLMLLAAELMSALSLGMLAKMRTDEDYVAWRELGKIKNSTPEMEETVSRLHSSIESAKKRCAAGILRAQVVLRNKRPPYHPLLTFALFVLMGFSMGSAQTIGRYEGILVDTTESVSNAGGRSAVFEQYLVAAKNLLTTEPPKSRVWVSNITVDSFRGDSMLVSGWTPEARGVFTDDLNRARRQLTSAFEQKSSGLSPTARGTDIFGALWRLKALFESAGNSSRAQGFPKAIWVFSDMINQTQGFDMPNLLSLGPEQMLERAKANRLIVPMNGYKVYVYGATPNGLSPQAWHTVKNFWTLYFHAAGAELETYSPECEVQR